MKLKSNNPMLSGWSGTARITTDHPASSYGIPILVIDGNPVGVIDAALSQYEIISATTDEREMLRQGGYVLDAPGCAQKR